MIGIQPQTANHSTGAGAFIPPRSSTQTHQTRALSSATTIYNVLEPFQHLLRVWWILDKIRNNFFIKHFEYFFLLLNFLEIPDCVWFKWLQRNFLKEFKAFKQNPRELICMSDRNARNSRSCGWCIWGGHRLQPLSQMLNFFAYQNR